MNKEEMPQTALDTNLKVGMEICAQADTEKNVLRADLNENKLNDDEDDHCLMRKEEARFQIKDAQDSINNNNEACNMMCGQLSCKKGCEDNDLTVMDSLTTNPHPNRENAVNKGKRLCGKRSTRSIKNNGKSTGLSTAVDMNFSEENYFVGCVNEQTTPASDVSPENRSQKQLRESLFSIIREGLKPTEDLKMLPSCLHKIAETYFLEENYEKAMRFIQLEREYHEQLLANLSSIQKQWESKWKRAKSTSLLSINYSEQDLSSEEFERLSNICSSHHHPQTGEWKFSVSEKPLTVQSLHQLRTTGTHDVDGPHPVCSDRECEPDIRTTIDRKPGVAAMTDNLPADVRSEDLLTRGADNQALPSHCEEQQMSIFEATLKIHTLPIGTSERANLDSNITSGDAGKNNSLLQQEATTNSRDAAEIETFSKEGLGERTVSPMIDKLISVPTIQSDSVLERSDDSTEGKSSLECTCPADTTTGDVAAIINQIFNADNKVSELQQSSDYSAAQKCSEERNSRAQHQAAVEFIASLLNSNLKDTEDFLAHLEFQEEIVYEEEMSPSPGESVLGDNFISLDELAKRIEIEEVNPAAGLVSILKKRNDNEGDKPSQSLQKQAKRKVRFQETEDPLDQEELGGGSCILLIALCIATVFLSIGGTALYCTFGDMDSSVCKDFAANVDFYYTQTVQGIEELRHWLFIT
ncbi:consortin [Hyperolius riggenbachi]|uniref:consortin n=1 Tax=Hyperolius riggenbachi TaxID=752182 RepID=UPI0035A2C68C